MGKLQVGDKAPDFKLLNQKNTDEYYFDLKVLKVLNVLKVLKVSKLLFFFIFNFQKKK